LSALVALSSDSVVNLWYGFGTVGTSVLLAPLLGAFFPAFRPSPRWAAVGMALSGVVALAWTLTAIGRNEPWLGVEPIFPGLLVASSALAAGVVHRRRIEARAGG